VLYGLAPLYISNIVTPVTHLPGRAHLRSAINGDFNIPRVYGQHSFSVSRPDAWNSLCRKLRGITVYPPRLNVTWKPSSSPKPTVFRWLTHLTNLQLTLGYFLALCYNVCYAFTLLILLFFYYCSTLFILYVYIVSAAIHSCRGRYRNSVDWLIDNEVLIQSGDLKSVI